MQIQQKQTILLFEDEPGGKEIVCQTGTCPGHFSEYYQKQYRAIIDSIKFNSQNNEVESDPDEAEILYPPGTKFKVANRVDVDWQVILNYEEL